VRRGWFLGGAQLKEALLERMGSSLRQHHGGEAKWEAEQQKAERLVAEELRKRRWREADLGKAGRQTR